MQNNLFLDIFEEIDDPRVQGRTKHLLNEILFMAVASVIGGVDKWNEMPLFCLSKIDWFKKFLTLENGIPSHDTFERVFSIIDPKKLSECFIKWIDSISEIQDGEIIAIDGKTVRRSFTDRKKKTAIHMVSAWASDSGVVLGQVKVDSKSNEITAIPELLSLLEIKNCIVTIDAMGCQKDIAEKIIEKKADYVFSLKGNQGTLHDEVSSFFELCFKRDFKEIKHDFYETFDTDHGRIERRKYWITDDISDLSKEKGWIGLKSFGMARSEVTIDDVKTIEVRYFITSLSPEGEVFGKAVRKHWGIENSLHWTLDFTFREDESRARKGHSAENFVVLRHIALNTIKKDTSKGSIKSKRLKAGWDNNFLEKMIKNI
jgi:predicted transposase YbfD/YdcC